MSLEFTLLMLAILASLYDLRTGQVPNWITLPLLGAGLIAHFPGTLDVWLFSMVLYTAWHVQWMSAGDAKLWLALLWALPVNNPAAGPMVFFASFFITGLLQILVRVIRRQPLTGVRSPGAWRAIPFMLLSLYVH